MNFFKNFHTHKEVQTLDSSSTTLGRKAEIKKGGGGLRGGWVVLSVTGFGSTAVCCLSAHPWLVAH